MGAVIKGEGKVELSGSNRMVEQLIYLGNIGASEQHIRDGDYEGDQNKRQSGNQKQESLLATFLRSNRRRLILRGVPSAVVI